MYICCYSDTALNFNPTGYNSGQNICIIASIMEAYTVCRAILIVNSKALKQKLKKYVNISISQRFWVRIIFKVLRINVHHWNMST